MRTFVRIILPSMITLISGCSVSDTALLERALSEAGKNAGEISRFLDRYDGERGEAAAYLVRGMTGQYGVCGTGLDSIEICIISFRCATVAGSSIPCSLQQGRDTRICLVKRPLTYKP